MCETARKLLLKHRHLKCVKHLLLLATKAHQIHIQQAQTFHALISDSKYNQYIERRVFVCKWIQLLFFRHFSYFIMKTKFALRDARRIRTHLWKKIFWFNKLLKKHLSVIFSHADWIFVAIAFRNERFDCFIFMELFFRTADFVKWISTEALSAFAKVFEWIRQLLSTKMFTCSKSMTPSLKLFRCHLHWNHFCTNPL